MKLNIALALGFVAAVASAPALAAVSGVVTAMYVPDNSYDPRPCYFFQVDNVGTWYAVLQSDTSLADEMISIRESAVLGRTITANTYGTVASCSNFTHAYGVFSGSPQ